MANTTNFGWETPDDTDLVKDGAAAIRTLGSAIDASLADLEGGTTGQVLKKNSNTDMDFIWSADSAGMTNPLTTTGDTIYSSSGTTPARLGIGTTGQVLTVSGGIPSWATPAGGGGKVLQVVQGTLTSSVSTSSPSLVDTGLTVSITPSSATSKIYVIASLPEISVVNTASATGLAIGAALLRGSTKLQDGLFGIFGQASSSNKEIYSNISFSYLDSPATTSSTTYKVQYVLNTGTTAYVNVGATKIASIIVFEIGA